MKQTYQGIGTCALHFSWNLWSRDSHVEICIDGQAIYSPISAIRGFEQLGPGRAEDSFQRAAWLLHCGTLLQIEGFNEEDAREFIFKYFGSRGREAVLSLEDRLPVSHHPTCKCVRVDPYTQACVGSRGELVAEFVLLGFYGTGIKTYMDAGFLAVNSISNY